MQPQQEEGKQQQSIVRSFTETYRYGSRNGGACGKDRVRTFFLLLPATGYLDSGDGRAGTVPILERTILFVSRHFQKHDRSRCRADKNDFNGKKSVGERDNNTLLGCFKVATSMHHLSMAPVHEFPWHRPVLLVAQRSYLPFIAL